MAVRKISDLKTFLEGSVKDIDTNLKSAGYDMFMSDKESGTQTLEKLRRKVKVMESKSLAMISELEREFKTSDQQIRAKKRRESELERRNEQLHREVKRLKTELDEMFPEESSLCSSVMDSSQETVSQDDVRISSSSKSSEKKSEDNSENKEDMAKEKIKDTLK